jgi:hypothetical protein
MPTPQLKVRSISSGATPPVLASHENTGGSQCAEIDIGGQPFGQNPRQVFGKAAAGDMRQRLDRRRSRGSPTSSD